MTLANKRIETYCYNEFEKECGRLQKSGYDLRYDGLKVKIYVKGNLCVTVKLDIFDMSDFVE